MHTCPTGFITVCHVLLLKLEDLNVLELDNFKSKESGNENSF